MDIQTNREAQVSARLDRRFFETASFPAQMSLPVRFDDLDVLSHVNNAAAIAMLQEARIAFHRMMTLPTIAGTRTVVGGVTVEFVEELTYPGTVEIGSGVIAVGRTSYTFGQTLRQEGKMAVCSRTTMVVTSNSGPCPIPAELAAALRGRCFVAPDCGA